MNILIIDDEPEKVENIVDRLNILGHSVSVEKPNTGFAILMNSANRFRYNLVLLDYLFKTDNEQFESGAMFCKELSKHDIPIPIILHTGTGDNFNIAREVLGDYGICYFYGKSEFSSETKSKILHIVSLPGFRRIWAIRQYEIRNDLKVFFRNTTTLYSLFWDEINKGKDANWESPTFNVNLHEGEYSLLELFCKPDESPDMLKISNELREVLNGISRGIKFTGEWNDKLKINKEGITTIVKSAILNEYRNYCSLPLSDYEKKKKTINQKAFNYLINVLIIRDEINLNDESFKSLNHNNSSIRVTESCDSKSGTTRFIHKMIGRRVVFAMQVVTNEFKFINNENNEMTFRKNHLAALLRDGNTKNESEFRSATVFSTHLGLEVDDSSKSRHGKEMCFLLENERNGDKYIMEEEEEWLKKYVNAALFFKKFIIEQYTFYERKFNTNLPMPNDLSDFKDFINQLCIIKSAKLEQFKKELMKKIKESKNQNYENVYLDFFVNTQ